MNLQPFIRITVVILTFAAASASAQIFYTPVTVTGFNADVVAENDGSPDASAFDPIPGWGGPWSLFESGLLGSGPGIGLPASRTFISASDSSIIFGLADYTANNALLVSNSVLYAPTAATLTLATPTSFTHLAILAASTNGGGTGTLVLNFSDGTMSAAIDFVAKDWYMGGDNVALSVGGRYSLDLASVQTGDSAPYFYQTAIPLNALGYDAKYISSITFTSPPIYHDGENFQNADVVTGIFAISGAGTTAVPEPSAYAAIAGLVGMLVALRRRSRRS